MAGTLNELLIGESKAMAVVREQAAAAVDADSPVLLEGERGTGRECVARALHAVSARRSRGFVRLWPEGRSEVERDLERAAGGTLLVKDIARVGRGSQRKLARVLRGRRSSDVRLVAATHIDLPRAVADGLFDAELLDRLDGARIVLPPLRRRVEDVPPLAARFARDAGELIGRRLSLATCAIDRLMAYPWPGNAVELKDVIGRAAFRARRATVEAGDVEQVLPRLEDRVPLEHLSFEEMVRAKIRGLLTRLEGYPVDDLYDEVISRVERPLIELVLERAGGSQVRAAKILGMNRNTLRKKIAERGLPNEPRKR
jgi:two-component system nitrogen regulation response regulator GlnG